MMQRHDTEAFEPNGENLWAKVRRTRYVLDNLTVVAPGTLDEFTAAAEPDEGALGVSATDFFDVEIGL